MIELGKKQKLTVVKSVDFGVYLGEDMQADAKNRVLLPSRQVPEGTKEGDSIEAFIYKDSQDRLIATTKEPKLQVGQTAVLKVSQVTRIGAFLDWGLEKDLLLPYHEQTLKVREGEDVLVALYIDKSSRLCATMKVYHYLSTRTPYVVGDMVKGRVYEISDRFGVFVAVDDKYSALLPKKEVFEKYRINQPVYARVAQVMDDGRLTLSVKKKIPEQMNDDASFIYETLQRENGFLKVGFGDHRRIQDTGNAGGEADVENVFAVLQECFKIGFKFIGIHLGCFRGSAGGHGGIELIERHGLAEIVRVLGVI